MNNKKKLTLKIIIYIVVRVIIIASFIFALFARNYYTAFQCVLVFVLFLLPSALDRKFNLQLPNLLEILIILFIFASIFLGDMSGFYALFPFWDTMLHTISGFVMAAIGISMINILNKSERVPFMLSPFFVALFSFCFSMTIGVFWEFFEYGADILLRFDMQKDTYITSITSSLANSGKTLYIDSVVLNGKVLNGYIDIGLIDTMNDLIVNAVGAFVLSVFGWLYLKGRGYKWIRELMPLKKKN